MTDGTIKLIGVVLYLGALLLIGVLASRRMKNLRDYFAGGKRLGFLSVAFSARATGESAWLLLGLTGMGAAVGVQAFWVVLGEIIGVGSAWIFMSRRFKRLTDRYDSITIPDYLESRFRDGGHLLRLVAAAALLVFVTIYVSAQIDATGRAFESVPGLGLLPSARSPACCVVLLYIVTGGGFVAVVWSDVFQGSDDADRGWSPCPSSESLPPVALVQRARRATDGHDPALTLDHVEPDALGARTRSARSLAFLVLIGLGFLGSPQIFVRFLVPESRSTRFRRGQRASRS